MEDKMHYSDSEASSYSVINENIVSSLNEQIGKLENELAELKTDVKNLNQSATASEQFVELKKELEVMKINLNEQKLRDVQKQLDHLELLNSIKCYANTLPVPDCNRKITLSGSFNYNSKLEKFLLHGASICVGFYIRRNYVDYTGHPPDFFDTLIKHAYKTTNTDEIVADFVIDFPFDKPVKWPRVLVEYLGSELKLSKEPIQVPTLRERDIDYNSLSIHYNFTNKNKPEVAYRLRIYFEQGAKCYKTMTAFAMTKC